MKKTRSLQAIAIGLQALAVVSCSERTVTAPDATICAPAIMKETGNLAIDDLRAASAAAVEDSRLRIVPEFQADSALGAQQATTDLALALDELATALSQPRGSLVGAVHRATRALATLDNEAAADGGHAADVSAVRLAVEQACELGT